MSVLVCSVWPVQQTPVNLPVANISSSCVQLYVAKESPPVTICVANVSSLCEYLPVANVSSCVNLPVAPHCGAVASYCVTIVVRSS